MKQDRSFPLPVIHLPDAFESTKQPGYPEPILGDSQIKQKLIPVEAQLAQYGKHEPCCDGISCKCEERDDAAPIAGGLDKRHS